MIGGIGMALMERSVVDARNGRISNAHFAGYAVPVHAATPPVMDVIFVEEHDPHVNPLGVKGVGEIAAVRPAPARGSRPRACSAPAVRGRHQLVAAQAAQRRSGEPGRRGRPGRAWAYGGQAYGRSGRRCGRHQPDSRQGSQRPGTGRRPVEKSDVRYRFVIDMSTLEG